MQPQTRLHFCSLLRAMRRWRLSLWFCCRSCGDAWRSLPLLCGFSSGCCSHECWTRSNHWYMAQMPLIEDMQVPSCNKLTAMGQHQWLYASITS